MFDFTRPGCHQSQSFLNQPVYSPSPQVAAILAVILLDYPDFCLIIGLLFMNATISYREEASADKVRPCASFRQAAVPSLSEGTWKATCCMR